MRFCDTPTTWPIAPSRSTSAARALARWRQSLTAALAGQFDDPLLPALADVVRDHAIPLEYLTAAIDGAEMDLARASYRDVRRAGDLLRSGGVDGRAGLPAHLGLHAAAAEAARPSLRHRLSIDQYPPRPGRRRRRGRVYLPQEDLRPFGYTADDLRAGVRDERFRRLMRFEIERERATVRRGRGVGPLARAPTDGGCSAA